MRAFGYGLAVTAILLAAVVAVSARDLGQWGDTDPHVAAWFKGLMQPDNPMASCCGEADAYWADSFKVSPDGNYIAIITDERPNEPLKRPPRKIGEEVLIPRTKVKWNQGNPTGHGVLFIGAYGTIYCYVPPGGV